MILLRLFMVAIICVLLNYCNAVEYGWLPRKEFVFSLHGKDLAGLPQLRPQYAGFSYKGELHVQSHSPRVLLVKLLNMKYSKIHDVLTESWWNDGSYNETKVLPISSATVVVKLLASRNPEIVLDSSLDNWQVNFIKGILSKVIPILNQNSTPEPNSNSRKPFSLLQDIFTVVEEFVVGRCKVLYNVSPLPTIIMDRFNNKLCSGRQIWQITKTPDFNSCEVLAEDHGHLPTEDCTPGGSNCGKFWSRASLTHMIGCGEMNNFILLSSATSSIMNAFLHLNNDSKGVVNSNLNITLTSIFDLKHVFIPPQNKQNHNSLFYSYSNYFKESYSQSCQDNTEIFEDTNYISEINDRNSAIKTRIKRRPTLKHVQSISKMNKNESKTARPNQPTVDSKHNKLMRTLFLESTKDSIDHFSDELLLENELKITGIDDKTLPPHQPFSMFSLAHGRQEEFPCLAQNLEQVIIDIASNLEATNLIPETHIMERLSLAVDICRSMSLNQLNHVNQQLFEVRDRQTDISNKNRTVLRDVMTICGTYPALQVIKGWIERRQIEGEEAIQVISSLPRHIQSPSQDLLEDFFEIVQSIAKRDDVLLKSASVLALSNLARQACVGPNTRKNMFSSIIKPMCTSLFIKRLIEWFILHLDSNPRIFIEALGNIGNADALEILRVIVEDKNYSTYIKTCAVLAMRYQGLQQNPSMTPLLLGMYHNYSLPVSIRTAAVNLLLYSDPSLAVWQRLAISTWYEPCPLVVHLVATTIRSMATTKDSLYFQMSKIANHVLPLIKPSQVSPYRPYNLFRSWPNSNIDTLVLEQLSVMESFGYSNYYYRHTSRSQGFFRTNIEASISSSRNFDDLWLDFKKLLISMTNENQHFQELNNKEGRLTLTNIRELLNLQSPSIADVEADLHIKINNIVDRIFTFNKDSVNHWAKGGQKFLSEIGSKGKAVTYQKADMDSFHISTTTDLGFPVEFSVRTPLILQAKGYMNIIEDTLIINATFMYASQLMSSLGIVSPWDQTAHVAGAYATNFIQVPPIQLAVRITDPEPRMKVTTYIDQHRLMYFSMEPFTSQRKMTLYQPFLQSSGTKMIHLGETVQVPVSWLGPNIKAVYSSDETEKFNPMDYVWQTRGIAGFPLMTTNMEARCFEAIINPLAPIHINFSMRFAQKTEGLLEFESVWENLFRKITKYLSDHKIFVNNRRTQSSNNTKSFKTSDHLAIMRQRILYNESNTEYSEGNDLLESTLNKTGYKVYLPTYESATGCFNASQVNPFTQSIESASDYLIMQSLSEINSGKAVVVNLNIQSTDPEQPVNIVALATYATSFSNRVSRFGLFLNKESIQLRMTAVHENPVDIAKDLTQRVDRDLQQNLYLDFANTFLGQDIIGSVKANFGASRVVISELRSTPLLIECSQLDEQNTDSTIDVKCHNIQAKITEIGYGNITFYYNEHAKFLENIAHMYMDAAKVKISTSEMMRGQGFNTMSFIFDYSPRTDSIYVQVATPEKSLRIRRLPIHDNPISSVINWARHDSSPKDWCGISTKRVRTFDGAEFKYEMQSDWLLITHDCSGKHNYSVTSRAGQNNYSLEVELNIQDQYILKIVQGPTVYVNGNEQSLNLTQPLLRVLDRDSNLLAHVVHTPDHAIHILLPQVHLDITYHGSSLLLKAGAGLQGRLCGVCGSFLTSGMEQFVTAQGDAAKSTMQFVESYNIKLS